MTKKKFKARIKALGLDAIQAAVLFDFSHPSRIYSKSESVSSASEFRLIFFEREKHFGRLDVWIDDKKEKIEKLRAKVNLARRKKYRKTKRSDNSA